MIDAIISGPDLGRRDFLVLTTAAVAATGAVTTSERDPLVAKAGLVAGDLPPTLPHNH